MLIAAGGLEATEGTEKPWGIWCKILQSSNYQVLHSNFRKFVYFKLIVKDFHQILDLINSHSLNKNADFNSAHLFSREEKEGGSYDPSSSLPATDGQIRSKFVELHQSYI